MLLGIKALYLYYIANTYPMQIIKPILFFIVLLLYNTAVLSQVVSKDYTVYHKSFIEAEKKIFINEDSIGGLKIFKETLSNYDFAFVDDCLEAFQLALVFKQDDYAMFFIKKAIDNGLELECLDSISTACVCNYYNDYKDRLTIHKAFIYKHEKYLYDYYKEQYRKYASRIDKKLLISIIVRHVNEQLYKNYHTEVSTSENDQKIFYKQISDDNLRFIDSLARHGIFLGERNIGIYSEKLLNELDLKNYTTINVKNRLLKDANLPYNTYVPVNTDYDLGKGLVYTIWYHNNNSYSILLPYTKEAIKQGYYHPRELISLKLYNGKYNFSQLALTPSSKKLGNVHEINKIREENLLPPYEVDYYKHLFMHKHKLFLFFGMFNSTR